VNLQIRADLFQFLRGKIAGGLSERRRKRYYNCYYVNTLALFQHQWQLHRKFVGNNYSYHREVYGRLQRILVEEAVQPFRATRPDPDLTPLDHWTACKNVDSMVTFTTN
jgi:hypothetical protein